MNHYQPLATTPRANPSFPPDTATSQEGSLGNHTVESIDVKKQAVQTLIKDIEQKTKQIEKPARLIATIATIIIVAASIAGYMVPTLLIGGYWEGVGIICQTIALIGVNGPLALVVGGMACGISHYALMWKYRNYNHGYEGPVKLKQLKEELEDPCFQRLTAKMTLNELLKIDVERWQRIKLRAQDNSDVQKIVNNTLTLQDLYQ